MVLVFRTLAEPDDSSKGNEVASKSKAQSPEAETR